MSAYVRIEATPMIRGDFLILALRDVGVPHVVVDGTHLALDAPQLEVAHLAACDHIELPNPQGHAWPTVRFERSATGYRLRYTSNFRNRKRWLEQVRAHYVEHEQRAAERERQRIAEAKRRAREALAETIAARARKRGYRVERRRCEDGRIVLELRQRVYR